MNVEQVNLPSVDLNLLKIFVTIMNERSITGAGHRLGLTQSATSNALNRLRLHCRDPLFVRTSTGMEPTPFAVELYEPVSQALGTIRQTFEHRTSFDPATSSRTFRIIQNNFGELQLLPGLMERLQSVAPNVKIVSLAIAREQYREALEDNTADLGIGRLPSGQFVQRQLYEDSLVCMMRRGHPVSGALTLERFLNTPQLAFAETFQSELLVRRALLKKASDRTIVMKVSSTAAIPDVIARTNLIAAVPARWFARLQNPQDYEILPLPFETERILNHAFWHERNHHDPGHKWLRNQIADLFVNFDRGASAEGLH